MRHLESQQVSWAEVHHHVRPFLELVGSWPMVGSPEWCALPDGPVKLASLYDGAQHWALRLELNQQACAEASKAVAGSADWARVASEYHSRAKFFAGRPWLRRATS